VKNHGKTKTMKEALDVLTPKIAVTFFFFFFQNGGGGGTKWNVTKIPPGRYPSYAPVKGTK